MSKLLLDDKPLLILPQLAKSVGLNESIILQQVHYWLKESRNIKEGHKWVYNTYEAWQEQFPFWSISTIRRTIAKLEKDGYLIADNFNKLKIDNTKWYRIDYSLLNRPSTQNEQTECSEWIDEQFDLNKPLPEITTETTTEKKKTKKTVSKNKYADLVEMTESEFNKLITQYGEVLTKKMIEVLDNYKGASGKTYKSDYKAILLWVASKVTKEYGHLVQNMPNKQEKTDEGVLADMWGDD